MGDYPLGKKLAAYRTQAGLSQTDVGHVVDKSRSLINKWESGVRKPVLRDLKKLGKLYGVSLDELLDENEPAQFRGGNRHEKKDDNDYHNHDLLDALYNG